MWLYFQQAETARCYSGIFIIAAYALIIKQLEYLVLPEITPQIPTSLVKLSSSKDLDPLKEQTLSRISGVWWPLVHHQVLFLPFVRVDVGLNNHAVISTWRPRS